MILTRYLKMITIIILISCMILAVTASFSVNIDLYAVYASPGFFDDYYEFEHKTGEKTYIMKDIETEDNIMKTSRKIHEGDKYITQYNDFYHVEEIEDNIAWARLWGRTELSPVARATSAENIILDNFKPTDRVQTNEQIQPGELTVGVFHSHGAESYVPSDGDEFEEEGGGIIDVGESFKEALQDKEIEVLHNTETHVPHDAGAYHRSRRTAEELVKEDTDVLFDIHRDAVPAEEYIENINGEPTVQIQFVVGRQNQNMQAIREFAESLKQAADDQHPGLIKGIFFAQGNYNQDLHPQSLLLEIGSHENTREGAEKSATLFADAVGYYFGQEEQAARGGIAMAALRSVLWIVLIAIIALGVFMLISTGGRDELVSKIKRFFNKEFAEFKGKKGDRDDQ